MSQYWIGNVPGSTVTSSEAERIAVVGRTVDSTTVAANMANVISTETGQINVAGVIVSSALADPTYILHIPIKPSTGATKVVGTTQGSTAVAGAALSDSGLISITCQTSTGGALRRYIKLYSNLTQVMVR